MMNNASEIKWPGWETVGLIGRGSFGAVYEIQRDVLGDTEKAALKVLSIPQNESDIDELYSDGYDDESISSTFHSHLKSIVAEYSLMRKMNGSANVVNCDDIKYIPHEDGIGWDIFIKMELLTPLHKALPEQISENMVIDVAKDLCAALDLCQKHNIVHRDIKPQNIFLSENGDYKLGDFGIAKTVEKTMGGTKIGTYKYMAPEVYNNQPYGVGADIYSLGLVLYWLLNEKRMPFLPLPPEKLKAGMDEEARNRRLSGESLPAPKNGSDELKALVLKACAYDPSERYASAKEMLDALSILNCGIKPSPVINSETTVLIETDENEFHKNAESIIDDEKNFEGEVVFQNYQSNKNKYIFPVVLLFITIGLLAVWLFNDYEKQSVDSDIDATVSEELTTESTTTEVAKTTKAPETTKVPKTTKAPKTTETTKAIESTQPINELTQLQEDWSSWSDSLPECVNNNDYNIEERTLYSSRKLEKTTSSTETEKEGWELYYTAKDNSFGAWSSWSSKSVSESSTRDVEKETRYRYRDKVTTTSTEAKKSGWTLYDTTYSWGAYGNWSPWSSETVKGTDSRKVEKKTQYRYRKKETTTSTKSSLDGWTKYDSEITGWTSWSSWQDNVVSASDIRLVETRTVPAVTKAVYRYYRWVAPDGKSAATYNMGSGYTYEAIELDYQMASTGTTSNGQVKRYGEYTSGRGGSYLKRVWYYETKKTVTVSNEYTQYRYKDAICAYYYFKWNSWSDYSDTRVTATSDVEVDTRTVYRYCDRKNIATYHYYKWNDWSKWSATPIKATDTKEVESKDFYRYRDKIDKKTYFFKRWGAWSNYTEEAVNPNDEIEVRTKTQYRYKSK